MVTSTWTTLQASLFKKKPHLIFPHIFSGFFFKVSLTCGNAYFLLRIRLFFLSVMVSVVFLPTYFLRNLS